MRRHPVVVLRRQRVEAGARLHPGLLEAALVACGGGGISGGARGVVAPVLEQAIYAADSGVYTYAHPFEITGAPDDTDSSRFAMHHDGYAFHLHQLGW